MPYFRSERLHAPAFHQKDQSFLTHMKNASLIHVLSMSPEKCKHCVLSKMNVIGLNYQSVNVLCLSTAKYGISDMFNLFEQLLLLLLVSPHPLHALEQWMLKETWGGGGGGRE